MKKTPTESVLSARWCVDNFEEIVASAAVVVVVLAGVWGVVTRYITAQAAAWTIEISTISFGWVVFFGSVACFKYKMHPAVDVPLDRLPASVRHALVWLNHLLLLGFFIFMTLFGVRFSIDAWITRSTALELPMTVLYAPVALCFGLMFVRYLQYVILASEEVDNAR